MPKLPICEYCGLEVTNNQPSKKIKGKTNHLSCYQNSLKQKYDNTTSKSNTNEKQELYSYIKSLFKIDEVTAMIDKQVEKYCLEYELTYSDILEVLKYYYETCNNPVNSDGIGILPYVLSEAKEHFKTVKQSRTVNLEQLKIVKPLRQTSPVSIKYERKLDTYKNKIIDIENL